jgi:hypothetical protein
LPKIITIGTMEKRGAAELVSSLDKVQAVMRALVHWRGQNVQRAARFLNILQRVSERRRGAFVGVCALAAATW